MVTVSYSARILFLPGLIKKSFSWNVFWIYKDADFTVHAIF